MPEECSDLWTQEGPLQPTLRGGAGGAGAGGEHYRVFYFKNVNLVNV